MKKSIWALGGVLTVVILAGALLIGGFRAPRMMRAFSNTNKTAVTQNNTRSQSASTPSLDGITKAVVNGNAQTVTTSLSGGTYSPIIVQKGIPVKWVITAKNSDITSCNNRMVLSSFSVEKNLVAGENIIEFTPTQSGTFTYSCWMGMVTSTVTVVDDINNITEQDKSAYTESAVSPSGGCNMNGSIPGGCCGNIN